MPGMIAFGICMTYLLAYLLISERELFLSLLEPNPPEDEGTAEPLDQPE